MTSVLAITTISTNSRKSLPKIPDVKALDVYLIACFVFVIFGIMEFLFLNCVNYANQRRAEKQNQRREKQRLQARIRKKRTQELDHNNNLTRLQRLREQLSQFLTQAKRSLLPLFALHIDDVTIIDKTARISFPAVFVLFNCFYWTYYNFF